MTDLLNLQTERRQTPDVLRRASQKELPTLTSEARRTLTRVAAGRVGALAVDAGGRQTLVHVFVAQISLLALGTDTEVLPAAGGEVDVRHAHASVQTATQQHSNLKCGQRDV